MPFPTCALTVARACLACLVCTRLQQRPPHAHAAQQQGGTPHANPALPHHLSQHTHPPTHHPFHPPVTESEIVSAPEVGVVPHASQPLFITKAAPGLPNPRCPAACLPVPNTCPPTTPLARLTLSAIARW